MILPYRYTTDTGVTVLTLYNGHFRISPRWNRVKVFMELSHQDTRLGGGRCVKKEEFSLRGGGKYKFKKIGGGGDLN